MTKWIFSLSGVGPDSPGAQSATKRLVINFVAALRKAGHAVGQAVFTYKAPVGTRDDKADAKKRVKLAGGTLLKLLALSSLLLLPACRTVKPCACPEPEVRETTTDGGVIVPAPMAIADPVGILGSTFTGEVIVSDEARQRYSGLLSRFGQRFQPTVWQEPVAAQRGRQKWVLTPEAKRLWEFLEQLDGEGR